MRAGRCIVLPSLDALPAAAREERALLEPQGIRSLIALPLFWQGHFWGFIGFDHVSGPRSWSSDDVIVLGLFANAFAQGLQRRRLDARLGLAAVVLRDAQEGIFATDASRRVIEVNPMFCQITGVDPEHVEGRSLTDVLGPAIDETVWSAVAEAGVWRGELDYLRPDGQRCWLRMTLSTVGAARDKGDAVVGVFADITPLRAQELRLQQMAYYDALTRLPNRSLLADRIQQALARSRRTGSGLAVCLLDLDRFKPVNDEHGHADGDRVLIEVGTRLHRLVRDNDTVARLGGDEFVLLLPDLHHPDECDRVLARVQKALAKPFVLADGTAVELSASIGVRTAPPLPDDADTLLREADQALYIAKREGRARIHRFDAEDARLEQQRSMRVNEVAEAIRRDGMCLHFQPIVDLKTGRASHLEALVRWQMPDGDLAPPGDWLPVIEHTPVIVDLGRWVLREALDACNRWQSAFPGLGVSVNVSARELCSQVFATDVAGALARHPGLPPGRLLLEVTESAPMSALPAALASMNACRALGVEFALDDFGTGYSSLTYLKLLPVSAVKLDRSFIAHLDENPDDQRIVSGIVQLVEGSGLRVVAEGIETAAQAREVLAAGCRLGQGFWLARPAPEDAVLEGLVTSSR